MRKINRLSNDFVMSAAFLRVGAHRILLKKRKYFDNVLRIQYNIRKRNLSRDFLMYKDLYNEWLNSEKLKPIEKQELEIIKDDEKEIEYRFGQDLEFGTAGMRGIIGMGTNMMNVYTVKRASQGLAEYIKKRGPVAKLRGVAIAYDTRRFSREFASAAAVVLASNKIKVYLFEQVHPVPMLSFAVRELDCVAGIMITASHNPKEYNGYKVYGQDGAQMSPETTAKVVKNIEKISSPLSDEILYSRKAINYVKFMHRQKVLQEN